jgi:hypothetical protein
VTPKLVQCFTSAELKTLLVELREYNKFPITTPSFGALGNGVPSESSGIKIKDGAGGGDGGDSVTKSLVKFDDPPP